jgi:hypothetical protein
MKTLGRIFIILVVTALITGALYFAVSASGTGTPFNFRSRGEQFQPGGAFQNGVRPEGTRPNFEGGRPGRGGDGGEGGGLSWVFGLLKNVGIVALVVAIIILPKSLGKKKRFATVKADSGDLS